MKKHHLFIASVSLETAVESNAPPFSGHFWPPSA